MMSSIKPVSTACIYRCNVENEALQVPEWVGRTYASETPLLSYESILGSCYYGVQ